MAAILKAMDNVLHVPLDDPEKEVSPMALSCLLKTWVLRVTKRSYTEWSKWEKKTSRLRMKLPTLASVSGVIKECGRRMTCAANTNSTIPRNSMSTCECVKHERHLQLPRLGLEDTRARLPTDRAGHLVQQSRNYWRCRGQVQDQGPGLQVSPTLFV